MAKESEKRATETLMPPDLFKLGQEQTDAMMATHKELLGAYEQASRLARVKSESELWSELSGNLMSTRSMPEAVSAFQKGIAQRMQMAAEDGKKLAEDTQKIMKTIAGALPNGWGGKR